MRKNSTQLLSPLRGARANVAVIRTQRSQVTLSRLRERAGEGQAAGVVQDIGYREGTGHRLQV